MNPRAPSGLVTRALAVVLLAAVAGGCGGGGGEATISTEEVLAALRDAGFRKLTVHSNEEAMKRAARDLRKPDLAQNPIDVDAVFPRGRFGPLAPVFAVRHPSGESARRAYENDRAALGGEVSVPPEAWPADFEPSRLDEERVCNVVVSSYNPDKDAALSSQFERAVELLRQACG